MTKLISDTEIDLLKQKLDFEGFDRVLARLNSAEEALEIYDECYVVSPAIVQYYTERGRQKSNQHFEKVEGEK